jgi:starch synthase
MKVLFVASECAPIVKVGGLADVVGSLPKALADLGIEVAVALPNYALLGPNPPRVLPGTDIPVFYLGSNSDYPDAVYPEGYNEYKRFATFCRQVINFLDTRTFEPHVIHCHDYHTSLVPDILHERKEKMATVLTIHDAGNVGRTESSLLTDADLNPALLRVLDFGLKDRHLDMLTQGILSADLINTVSPTYAKEILNKEFSGELSELLMAREARVSGIINGIDTDYYDPRRDTNISLNFGPGSAVEAKEVNKGGLQSKLGLNIDPDAPLYAMVTRLVERKGIDLVIKNLPYILESGSQLVILGKGEAKYEDILLGLAKIHPKSLAFVNAFDEPLSHQIYAASNYFLVPSRVEPCGLTQMIAMRYGSLPIVHKTGGLADTVNDNVTGFVFEDYSPEGFLAAFVQSVKTYNDDKKVYKAMVEKAMGQDFSWKSSATSYIKLYERALQYNYGIARTVGGEIRERSVGGWTLLSEARSKRPFDEKQKTTGTQHTKSSESDVETCPFEAGHEHMSPGELFRVGSGVLDNPGWEVRVIPNKYPLVPAHEVVIYSPDHSKDLDQLPQLWVEKVVWAYLSRYRHYEDIGYVHIFCNHGQEAAASLNHPHSQIVVLPKLPDATLESLEAAGSYFEKHRHCPYCDTLSREEATRSHLVWQNDLMVVTTPYASDWPYELTILPKTHRQSFGNISDAELKAFAKALQVSIKLLKTQVPNLAYNFWIHSVPDLMGFAKTALYYHWHLDIAPRVKKLGGLELGVGVMVDDLISPEKAAEVLRSQLDSVGL